MKAGRVHRVALSGRAIALLSAMRAARQLEFVFSGRHLDRPMSNMAFLALLKRMGRPDLTAHGFRSSFRDWAAERTDHSQNDVVEMALACSIKDKVEAAYQRGDLFEKWTLIMEEWARHCFPGAMAWLLEAVWELLIGGPAVVAKGVPLTTMKHRMGDVEPRLVIADQPAAARRPAKRTSYHTSTGQDLKARLGIGPAYDLENEVPETVPTLRNTPAREQRGS